MPEADQIPQGTFDDTNRPAWLIANQAEGTQPLELHIDGTWYIYTLVKDDVAPDLPYAVGYPDQSTLFISEKVPEEDRRFILAHEVRENTRSDLLKLPEEQRCIEALKFELKDVQNQAPQRYAQYVRERGAFFDALDELYKQPLQAEAVARKPGFRQGIRHAQAHIHDILANLPADPHDTLSRQ